MAKILVLGAFGYRATLFDGQTIKTRNLLDLLRNNNVDVDYFDTQDFHYNKCSILTMFWKIINCSHLYYLPAQNNLKFIFPIIYILCSITRSDIHYFVVGGWLKEFLEDKPLHRKFLSKVRGIHCETHLMKDVLNKDYRFRNVDVFPNFRNITFVPRKHHTEGKLKVVFMARIIKMKGLDTIFSMGDLICQHRLEDNISIDFYGPQQDEDGDIEYFNQNIKRYDFMHYHGPCEPSNIYSTLEQYDVMILPTHFFTEGLPGSILDAYIAGIPVIATKWKHASEFIDDGQTGYIIPFDDHGQELFSSIRKLFDDTILLNEMKELANKKSISFSSEKAWELITEFNK